MSFHNCFESSHGLRGVPSGAICVLPDVCCQTVYLDGNHDTTLVGTDAFILCRHHSLRYTQAETQYGSAVEHIRSVLVAQVAVKVEGALSLANAFVYEPSRVSAFPGFERFGAAVLALAHARTAGLAPIVYAADLPSANAFTAAHAAELAGPAVASLSPAARQSVLSALENGVFEAAPSLDASGSVVGISFLPASAPVEAPAGAPGGAFFTPALQLAPAAATLGSWNLNVRNSTDRRVAQDRALASRAAGATGLVLLGADVFNNVFRASTTIFAPTLHRDPETNETTATGFAFLSFSWDDVLMVGMPAYASLDVVVSSQQQTVSTLGARNEPASAFTFSVSGGVVTNLGFGAFAEAVHESPAEECGKWETGAECRRRSPFPPRSCRGPPHKSGRGIHPVARHCDRRGELHSDGEKRSRSHISPKPAVPLSRGNTAAAPPQPSHGAPVRPHPAQLVAHNEMISRFLTNRPGLYLLGTPFALKPVV